MQIITGAAGSGKTSEIFNRISKLDEDECSILIVPGQYTYHTERKLLEALGVSACFKHRVYSNERLAYMIASQTPLKQKKVLSKEAKALLTRYVTDTSVEGLGLYRSSALKKGFADDISVLISELLRNSLDPEVMLTSAEKSQSGMLSKKLKDVAVLYKKYFDTLSERFIDPDNFLLEAAEYIPDCEFIKNTHFFFDSFYTLDKSDTAFIAALDKASKGVTFAITYEDDPFYSLTQDTLEQLKEACENTNEIHLKPREVDGALSYLKSHYISPAPYMNSKTLSARDNTNSQIMLYEAPDMREEVRFVASEIVKIVRENNMSYKDIAISCPQIETYAAYIEDIFSDYDIPFFIDIRRQIVYTSPIRAFIFLLGAEKGSMQDIIAYAKCGFTDLSDEECEMIENYVMEFGIKGDAFTKEFVLNNEEISYDLIKINDIRQRLISPALNFEKAIKDAQNVAEWCKGVYSFLSNEGFEERIHRMCEDFIKEGDYENANIYTQIYNKLIESLEVLYELFANDKPDNKLLYRMMSYSLSVSDVGVIPSVRDKVSIGDVLRSRAGDIKAFFIMGATEGLLTAEHSSAAILTDKDKNELEKMGLKITNTSQYRKKKEDFLLYTLLCTPKERLYVSRHLYNTGDDSILSQAELFETLIEMFGSISNPKKPNELNLSVKSAFDAMCTDMSERKYDSLRDKSFDIYYDSLMKYFSKTPSLNNYLDSANAVLNATNKASLNVPEGKKSALTIPSSVSRLEKYAQCPFSYFMEYIIRPKQRVVHKVRSADTGSVLHKVVEEFSRKLINGEIDQKNADKATITNCVCEICEQVITRYRSGIYKTLSESNYLKSKLITTAVSASLEIYRQLTLSDFLLEKTEAIFSEKGEYMPIYIKNDDGSEVLLRGIIDRVDSCMIEGKKYIKIIDYKSGSTDFDATKAYYGLNMQLPVYISAALSGDKEAMPAGIFYLHLKQKEADIKKNTDFSTIKKSVREAFKLSGITLNNLEVIEALDKNCHSESFIQGVKIKNGAIEENNAIVNTNIFLSLIEHTRENIKRLSDEIMSGNISIHPYKYKDNSPCKSGDYRCMYEHICKFSTSFKDNSYNIIHSPEGKNALSSFFKGGDEK